MKLSLFAWIVPFCLGACTANTEDGGANADGVEALTARRGSRTGDAGTGAQTCAALNGKADVRCTPGAFNPAVTQSTIDSTICVSGWTSTVRPPSSYTSAMKDQQKPEYGEQGVADADLEEDHLVPLELGGNPHDPTNLWPQPRESISKSGQGAETKDKEETDLKRAVCSGQITLDAARQKILADWTH